MLLDELKDVVCRIYDEGVTVESAVDAIMGVLEKSDEVELLKDEMKLVMVIRKPKWRDVPFPSIDTIQKVLHHPDAVFQPEMEFEFHRHDPFMDV